ncbi:membrane bound O-acyl transferase MBOAT family protein [Fluviicola taffensis DSM 16823]|uniref:Membrane bound O-acyl transferase MBOAT family protein n=2 Tax=Fluviicola TaxID=332102 RepID=F2IE79_FLUTR|nr:membrane bound O-acyl transferase MBOAT family protein [Fluviicola taffensis DSM 16823]
MLFNSFEFLLFFPIVTVLFYLLPHKYRWVHLLAASCIFYMFFIPQYILILFVTIIIDYIAGIWIEKTRPERKKAYLVISIVSTCLVLFIFKYFDFFNHNMVLLSHKFGFYYPERVVNFILPIGLSFHTFQSLSYVIEVYRGNQKAEKHFGIYSLYVMFYPQLVTGPIERPQNLLVQLREEKKFDYSNIARGLRLILFGLFIKMVVADNIAVYVDQIYANPSGYNTFSILKGLFLYSFQIYCDFFGYSTIAVGCARVMGYNLMDNFKTPYLSKSIGEFWQRWHISLSTWFRDYVYFSLGGNKVKIQRWMINILIVFIVSGLWHGANWTFILWGLAHGLVYISENIFNRLFKIREIKNEALQSVWNIFKIIKTFVIVSFIWVLFRASDLQQVKTIFKSIIHNLNTVDNFTVEPKAWLFLGLFIIIDIVLFNTRFDFWCTKRASIVRWSLYTSMIFLIIVFSSVENFPFIYFQF